MIGQLTQNTEAILLLTAPLIIGKYQNTDRLLTLSEYNRVARRLREIGCQPSDLLSETSETVIHECRKTVDEGRLKELLARGFLLSQAVERWASRAFWLLSRADDLYPKRWKNRLKEDAPPILYGCGPIELLETESLAVVGSRDVDNALLSYSTEIGRLAAKANRTIVSGGARGIDLAAMRGAINTGGKVVGVLAEGLEKTAASREHREMIKDGRLTLISPYDPSAGFNVGHAMQRNKLIYALADAALVVNSDLNKGGTWAGAVEQLEKFKFVTVYVRSNGSLPVGIKALQQKGALPWPNPRLPEDLIDAIVNPIHQSESQTQSRSLFSNPENAVNGDVITNGIVIKKPTNTELPSNASAKLFATVRDVVSQMAGQKTESEFAEYLGVNKTQAHDWLTKLVDEGILKKLKKPVRFELKQQKHPPLFE